MALLLLIWAFLWCILYYCILSIKGLIPKGHMIYNMRSILSLKQNSCLSKLYFSLVASMNTEQKRYDAESQSCLLTSACQPPFMKMLRLIPTQLWNMKMSNVDRYNIECVNIVSFPEEWGTRLRKRERNWHGSHLTWDLVKHLQAEIYQSVFNTLGV